MSKRSLRILQMASSESTNLKSDVLNSKPNMKEIEQNFSENKSSLSAKDITQTVENGFLENMDSITSAENRAKVSNEIPKNKEFSSPTNNDIQLHAQNPSEYMSSESGDLNAYGPTSTNLADIIIGNSIPINEISNMAFMEHFNVPTENKNADVTISDMPIVILQKPYEFGDIPSDYLSQQCLEFNLNDLNNDTAKQSITIFPKTNDNLIQIENHNEVQLIEETENLSIEYEDKQISDHIHFESRTLKHVETCEKEHLDGEQFCNIEGQDSHFIKITSNAASQSNLTTSLPEMANQNEIERNVHDMENECGNDYQQDPDYNEQSDPDYNAQSEDLSESESENNDDEAERNEINNEDDQNENNNGEENNENANANKKKNRTGKKRVRNELQWKTNKRKRARASGEEYMSSRNTKIRARQLKAPCNPTCKLKCFEIFAEEERQNILNSFWNKNVDYDRKRQFVASCIEETPIQRQRNRNGTREGKRTITYIYTLTLNGARKRVCKKFFLNTLDISQNFVDFALRKTTAGGITKTDLRKGHIPHNLIPDEVRQGIRDHINKFPYYESHYSREKTSRKYLECDLNVTKMYQLYYDDSVAANNAPDQIGKLWLYREIFNTGFNLSFKKPSNDTCDTCDSFTVKLKDCSDFTQRQELQTNYEKHIEDSQNRYKMKAADKETAKIANNKKVVMLDLEKCLPTPLLKNGQSFYSLKLWTFNLTIHDSTVNKTFCMMWDETVAGRGGNEVASAILKWLTASGLPPEIEELTIWSDNCPSQNRNLMMVMCYFYIFTLCPNIRIVNHKYLLRGHTHLEADTDHALIEKQVKKTPAFQIATPWDWQQLVRITSTKFSVINMDTEDFLDMKSLYSDKNSLFIKSRKSESGNVLRISEAVHLQVKREKPGHLLFKTDFSQTEFDEVNFNRRLSYRNADPLLIPPIRNSAKPISTKKYKHLMNLLQWVPSRFHQFYKDIKHENVKDEDD